MFACLSACLFVCFLFIGLFVSFVFCLLVCLFVCLLVSLTAHLLFDCHQDPEVVFSASYCSWCCKNFSLLEKPCNSSLIPALLFRHTRSLYTVPYTLYTIHCIIYIVYYTLYNIHSLYIQGTVYHLHLLHTEQTNTATGDDIHCIYTKHTEQTLPLEMHRNVLSFQLCC